MYIYICTYGSHRLTVYIAVFMYAGAYDPLEAARRVQLRPHIRSHVITSPLKVITLGVLCCFALLFV